MAGGKGRIRKHESGGGGRYGAYVQDDVEPLPQIEMLRSSYIPIFKCTMCARCCAGKVISLFDTDVRRLGEYAESCTEQMDEEEMALTGAERKMKMVDGKCAFLKEGRCIHYDLRPDTCRRHPFIVTRRHVLTASTCPGIDWTGRRLRGTELLRLSMRIAPKIDAYMEALAEERAERRGQRRG